MPLQMMRYPCCRSISPTPLIRHMSCLVQTSAAAYIAPKKRTSSSPGKRCWRGTMQGLSTHKTSHKTLRYNIISAEQCRTSLLHRRCIGASGSVKTIPRAKTVARTPSRCDSPKNKTRDSALQNRGSCVPCYFSPRALMYSYTMGSNDKRITASATSSKFLATIGN